MRFLGGFRASSSTQMNFNFKNWSQNYILDAFWWPKGCPKSTQITKNPKKRVPKSKMFAYIVTTGRYIVISVVLARTLVFFAHADHKRSPKNASRVHFGSPKRIGRLKKEVNVILTKPLGDQREPQLQFLAAERNLGWILGAKRGPKVIPNHPKSQKIGAKNKNVVMHGRQWKKYRDFVF